ncbi:YicC/YloC family endoribonuclease [Methylophilus sp. VKM B-3414]|jgi:uncharacterized protein (TIGR00255 family)|nr:YicC/YloC family endoribonuclease [Methylophilus sp. VKM B-3414]
MTIKNSPASQPMLSMTGFAATESRFTGGLLLIELRAVNHRYLELNVKIDDNLRQFEAQVRELLQSRLGRGKVECRINLKSDAAVANLTLNPEMVGQIAQTLAALQQHFPQAQPVNLVEVLKLPGVCQTESIDTEAMAQSLLNGLSQAIDELIAARQREGEKLKQVLLDRLQGVREQISIVKPLLPALISQYQDKLTTKLREAMQAEDDRVRQEIVLYAQRIDVDEELARLNAHIVEMDRILTAGGTMGKKLDFLMQEMNREANTLGSKSVAIETTQVSMQLKVLIEQMREQIQNIE